MRKAFMSIIASLALFGALLSLSGVATADHMFARWDQTTPVPGQRLHWFPVCILGTTFPADTGFFVAHGWIAFSWTERTAEERRGFNYPTTTFMLEIDGVPQKSAQHNNRDAIADTKGKWFVTEIHKGLPAGPHVFTFTWYIDGSIDIFTPGDFKDAHFAGSCTGTITFV